MRGRNLVTLVSTAAVALLAAACVPVTPPPPTPLPAAPAALAALAAPPPEVTPPAPAPVAGDSNFNRTFVTGLDQPWDIAFQPAGTGSNPDLVFTENNSGKISAIVNGARRDLDTIASLDTSATFDPSGEGGLMGLAFHPAYATDPYLYVCYSTTVDNRVARLTVTRDASGDPVSLSDWTTIVTGMPHTTSSHHGCRVRFQPGSSPPALFITMGDDRSGPAPQSDTVLGGKVLRVTDSGGVYPGNASGALWYTKGHRNPQGIAFNPKLGNAPYSVEHGPNKDDEVNKLVNGGNGGWDPQDANHDYDELVSMTDLVKFPNAMRPVWRSGDLGTIAPSGGTFLSGPQWKAWDGALVLAVLKNSELRVLPMNPDGTVSGQFQMAGSAVGTRLRSAVEGPDGNLYVCTDVPDPGGAIWQVVPS